MGLRVRVRAMAKGEVRGYGCGSGLQQLQHVPEFEKLMYQLALHDHWVDQKDASQQLAHGPGN